MHRFPNQLHKKDGVLILHKESNPARLAVISRTLLGRSFERSRRRTWSFHIHNPVRTITGRKTNRVAGAFDESASCPRASVVSLFPNKNGSPSVKELPFFRRRSALRAPWRKSNYCTFTFSVRRYSLPAVSHAWITRMWVPLAAETGWSKVGPEEAPTCTPST